MSELKLCPFCGKKVSMRHENDGWASDRNLCPDGTWSIWHGDFEDGCLGRNVQFQWFKTEEEAISAWNNRPEPPQSCNTCRWQKAPPLSDLCDVCKVIDETKKESKWEAIP